MQTTGTPRTSITNPTASAGGIFAGLNPYGALRVSPEPTVEFFDPFDIGQTTAPDSVRWSSIGTTTPVVGGGACTLAPAVGANVTNSSEIISLPTFVSPGLGFHIFAAVVSLEAASSATNTYRFWGKSSYGGTYAAPVTDGVGFDVDANGALNCVVWAGGTKYVINSTNTANISSSVVGAGGSGTAFPAGALASYGGPLTWKGGQHRYAIMMRSDVIFWFIEGQDLPVASVQYLPAQVQTLSIRFTAYTNPSATSTAFTFAVGAAGLSNSTANNVNISDATYPHRKVQVGSTGGASIKGVNVVTQTKAYAAGATGATNNAPVGDAGNVTFIVKNTVGGTPYTGNPVIVFEQSDDGGNWTPLQVTSTINNVVYLGTVTLPVGVALTEWMFDAALEGVAYVRARVTTGTTANGMTIYIIAGTLPFSPTVGISALPALTKGTQGLSGVAVQDLKDSGRSPVTITAQAPSTVIATTAETAIASQFTRGQAAAVTTAYSVSTGKTLRLQNLTVSVVQRGGTPAVVGVLVNVRLTSTTGPIIWTGTFYLPATANAVDRGNFDFPDGLEIAAGTAIVVTTTNTVASLAAVNFALIGFEY